jgi:seryl-tRNA synthetase
MLDKKFILSNIELVRKNIIARNMSVDIDGFVDRERQWREALHQLDEANREANTIAERMSRRVDNETRTALIERARVLRDERARLKEEVDRLSEEYQTLHAAIPNMAHPEAPVGQTDEQNVEIGHGATEKRAFDFTVQDHLEICERLDLVDMAAGSRVAGHGFYYLKNEAVLLDLALQLYALRLLEQNGFTLITTPDVARSAMLAGTGYSPRGSETQIYNIVGTDLGLIATSEITLAGMYAGHVFATDDLPLLLCGLSHCFRTEAGAHGRASRGLYRVHQFSKVEMFAFGQPEQADALHTRLLQIEQRLFDDLRIPYRCVDTSTGDLGASAYRKFDLEAWMPGRDNEGGWGEVTSTSNCTDYQARRLNIRYKNASGNAEGFVHTLNGTAVATGRAIIAILENYQNSDGSVTVPECLRGVVGKDVIARSVV